jgi:hypothetical protein
MLMTLLEKRSFFRRLQRIPSNKVSSFSINRNDHEHKRDLMRHLEEEMNKNENTKIVFFAE